VRADPELERVVRSWLQEEGHEDAERVLFTVLNQVDTTPQRRAGWLARRFPIMNNKTVRYGIAAAAVLVIALVGANLLPGANRGSSPTPSPTTSPTSSPRPSSLAVPFGTPLDPGRYALSEQFPVSLTFEIEESWNACSESGTEQNLCRPDNGISFVIVENVAADPCNPDGGGLVPAVGPTVDDLVTAISSLEGFQATAPVAVTVGGFQGVEFELAAPAEAPCDGFGTWMTASRTTGMGLGEFNLVQVIDAGGQRLLIAASYDPSSAAYDAEVRRILESVQIES
jgi:hypothetical protein